MPKPDPLAIPRWGKLLISALADWDPGLEESLRTAGVTLDAPEPLAKVGLTPAALAMLPPGSRMRGPSIVAALDRLATLRPPELVPGSLVGLPGAEVPMQRATRVNVPASTCQRLDELRAAATAAWGPRRRSEASDSMVIQYIFERLKRSRLGTH